MPNVDLSEEELAKLLDDRKVQIDPAAKEARIREILTRARQVFTPEETKLMNENRDIIYRMAKPGW
jgi:hypothetical protein